MKMLRLAVAGLLAFAVAGGAAQAEIPNVVVGDPSSEPNTVFVLAYSTQEPTLNAEFLQQAATSMWKKLVPEDFGHILPVFEKFEGIYSRYVDKNYNLMKKYDFNKTLLVELYNQLMTLLASDRGLSTEDKAALIIAIGDVEGYLVGTYEESGSSWTVDIHNIRKNILGERERAIDSKEAFSKAQDAVPVARRYTGPTPDTVPLGIPVPKPHGPFAPSAGAVSQPNDFVPAAMYPAPAPSAPDVGYQRF